MPDVVNITAKNLVKYELTELGKKTAKIFLPQNSKGDRHLDFPTSHMTDYLAKELLNRKDGRGSRFVRLKSTSTSSVKKN